MRHGALPALVGDCARLIALQRLQTVARGGRRAEGRAVGATAAFMRRRALRRRCASSDRLLDQMQRFTSKVIGEGGKRA